MEEMVIIMDDVIYKIDNNKNKVSSSVTAYYEIHKGIIYFYTKSFAMISIKNIGDKFHYCPDIYNDPADYEILTLVNDTMAIVKKI